MMKIATMLVILVCLTVIGCQPPEGLVTTEKLDELKTEIQTLKTDLANTQTALDSLTKYYNEHVKKYHKGGPVAPQVPKRGVKPPTQK